MLVEVLVDVPRIIEDRFFTYRVPAQMQARIARGQRVLVELGEQLVRGFVFAVVKDDAPGEFKPILSILDEEPLLTEDMIALAEWVAQYYMAPLGRVVKAMIPAALDNPRGEIVTLAGEAEVDPTDSRVGEVLGSSWKGAAGGSSREVAELLKQGKIEVRISNKIDAYPSSVQYSLAADVSDQELSRLAKKAPRQARALKFFLKQGSPIPERQALQEVGLSILDRLVSKGYLMRIPIGSRVFQDPLLNREQSAAAERIHRQIEAEKYGAFLLFGVTGSGKTEIYLNAIEKARQQGKQSLVLIPEIGLTQQIVSIFEQRLGAGMSVLHSQLSDAQRALEWLRVRDGSADVVVGARSAVFAPFRNLGLVIMDEEQETSFRQEENPRYHAREVAAQRAEMNDAVLILGSATPSLETFYRAQTGEIELLRLTNRIASSGQSLIETVDARQLFRRGGSQIFSPELVEAIRECLDDGDQAIIFLNRRGYATTVLCPACGIILTCDSCEVALNYHRDIERAVCHYCGDVKGIPSKCPRCGQGGMRYMGTGTQKVEEGLRELFPEASLVRMDTDSTRRSGLPQIVQRIRDKKVDIAVGTQMIAKGFDFPGVTLVGVINADPLLGLPDFRARERAFQLLVQVGGRAGRGETRGRVIIQTVDPEDPFFELVRSEDYESFYEQEIQYRMLLNYPPFAHLIKLVFSGTEEHRVQEEAEFARALLEEMVGEMEDDVDILGPASCLRPRLNSRYRYQIILKSSRLDSMRSITRYIIDRGSTSRVRIDVDVDPLVMI